MQVPNYRSRRSSLQAANDNVARATRDARRQWAEQQSLVKGNLYSTLKLAINFADASGRFYVDGGAFAQAVKVSPRTVFNHIKLLIRAGLIKKTGKKRWVHAVYELTLPIAADDLNTGSEIVSHNREDNAAQFGKTCAHKTHKDPYDQGTSSEVHKRSEWIKKKEDHLRGRPGPAMPLNPDEGEHLPAELRGRFVAWFGPDTARSWLLRCTWRPGEDVDSSVLETTSEGVKKWFEREARSFCQDNRIEVRLVGGTRG